jgi:hypothetical protein
MDKGLIFRIYQKFKKLGCKRTKKNPINKWANELETVLRRRNTNG